MPDGRPGSKEEPRLRIGSHGKTPRRRKTARNNNFIMFQIYTRRLPAFLISSFKYCSSFAVSFSIKNTTLATEDRDPDPSKPAKSHCKTKPETCPTSCLQEQALQTCLKTRPPKPALPTKPSLCYKEATAEPGRGTSPSTSSTELKLGENYLSCKQSLD